MSIKHPKEVAIIGSSFMRLKTTVFHKSHRPKHMKDFSSSTPLVIDTIAEHYIKSNEPISIGEVADKTNLTAAAISQILNPLEEQKIIRREKSDQDRRQTFVSFTKRGRFFLRNANNRREHTKIIDDLIDYLGEADAAEFLRLTERINDFIDNRELSEKDSAENA